MGHPGKAAQESRAPHEKINIQYIADRMRDNIAEIYLMLRKKMLTGNTRTWQLLLSGRSMMTISGRTIS